MIELIDLHSPKVIALRVSGKIEKADMEKTIGALQEKMKQADQVAVYVELKDWTGFTFEALVEDLRFAFTNFKKFSRKAVVSDKKWIEKFTTVADKFFPSHEVRHFTPERKQEAMDWITS